MEEKIKQVNIYRQNLAIADPDESDIAGEVIISSVKYDTEGRECLRINYDSEGNPEETVRITYSGKLAVEEAIEMEDGHAERTKHEYDENGRLAREWRFYLEGEPDEISYTYDNEGNMVERRLVDSDGEEGEKHIWQYSSGLLTKEEAWNEYGDKILLKTYEYDEERRPGEICEISYSDGLESKMVTIFNDKGHVETEKRYDVRGRLVARNTYTYDEQGNALNIEEESVNGKTLMKFSYDEHGNNVLQEEFDAQGELISMVKRNYGENNRQTDTEVRIELTPVRGGQHYRLRYDYKFHGA